MDNFEEFMLFSEESKNIEKHEIDIKNKIAKIKINHGKKEIILVLVKDYCFDMVVKDGMSIVPRKFGEVGIYFEKGEDNGKA